MLFSILGFQGCGRSVESSSLKPHAYPVCIANYATPFGPPSTLLPHLSATLPSSPSSPPSPSLALLRSRSSLPRSPGQGPLRFNFADPRRSQLEPNFFMDRRVLTDYCLFAPLLLARKVFLIDIVRRARTAWFAGLHNLPLCFLLPPPFKPPQKQTLNTDQPLSHTTSLHLPVMPSDDGNNNNNTNISLLPLLASAAYFLLPLLAAGSATPALSPLSTAGSTALFPAAAVPGSQLAAGYGLGHAGGDG